MIHFDVNYLIHQVSAEVPTKHLADMEDRIPENYSQFQSLDSKKNQSVQQLSNHVDGAQGGALWVALCGNLWNSSCSVASGTTACCQEWAPGGPQPG